MARPSHLTIVRSAEPDDPIFTAIERHRRSAAIWSAAVHREFASEGKDEARFIKAKAAEQKARADRDDAVCDLVRVKPTTIAGVVALLKYYGESAAIDDRVYWPDDLDDEPYDLLLAHHAARALEWITRSEA